MRRRALAQNFLVDDRAIAAVVGTLHPPPGSTVVDLGAGAGALTAAVAARGVHVIAVELDAEWARVLRTRAPAWGSVEVVHADALAVPFPAGPHYVISSAPYNIGTQLVRRVLAEAHGLTRAAIVLQRETARRLAAGGRFAATWAPWFELRVRGRIAPAAFRPRPAVESAILTIVPRPLPLLSAAAYGEYDRFLATVFAGRGRTLADRVPRRALAAAGVDGAATPSRVPPEAYAALFRAATRPTPRARAAPPAPRRRASSATPSGSRGRPSRRRR